MATITISRQFGAGGRTLGKKLAKKLGYYCADDVMVKEVAERMNVSSRQVKGFEKEGATNLMKVHLVGEVLIKGTGVGKETTIGKVCVVRSAAEAAEKFNDGDVMVTNATDKDMMPYIEKASALIVEEGGYTSHAAIVALSLKKPAVVGAKMATELLADGEVVTLDAQKCIVYEGESRIL